MCTAVCLVQEVKSAPSPFTSARRARGCAPSSCVPFPGTAVGLCCRLRLSNLSDILFKQSSASSSLAAARALPFPHAKINWFKIAARLEGKVLEGETRPHHTSRASSSCPKPLLCLLNRNRQNCSRLESVSLGYSHKGSPLLLK